jgi:hypothetical protein
MCILMKSKIQLKKKLIKKTYNININSIHNSSETDLKPLAPEGLISLTSYVPIYKV